jgi:AraC-like DNA-binding protein
MAHREGIADLGFRVGQAFGADSVDPQLTELLRRSPTLYRGLLAASELTNRTITNCRFGLLQPLDSDYTYFFHSPSCDARNPAIEQIGWFGLTTLIGMVRVFTGPKWHPTEIGVMTDRSPGLYIREQFWATRIRLSQPYSYLALENRLLSLPPLNPETAMPVSASPPYEPQSQQFADSLRQVLRSYIQENDLSIEFAAGLCDTSKRSLQRKLKATGTCYSAVLDQARLDVAKWMLRDPGMKVIDVAQRLGYSNATHFARAFRRIAGVTPRVFRQQYQH